MRRIKERIENKLTAEGINRLSEYIYGTVKNPGKYAYLIAMSIEGVNEEDMAIELGISQERLKRMEKRLIGIIEDFIDDEEDKVIMALSASVFGWWPEYDEEKEGCLYV